jgi:hypothetical protein
VTDTLQHDYSDVTRLDDHFAERRAQELKLEAEAQRAQQEAQLIPLHNDRIRKMGLAALAAGAGIGLAFFGASFLIAPKERIVYTPGPERVVTKEVPGPERVITREAPKEVPSEPVAPPSDAPKTPEEKKFVEQPEYKSTIYHGRIITSVDGRAISFADGVNWWPAHWDGIKVVKDKDLAFDTDELVGDLAMCVEDAHELWVCTAMHEGHEVPVHGKPSSGQPT